MSNIVTAVFGGSKTTRTRRLWKIDRGMQLQFVGLNLPTAYQVHFANSPSSGQAKVVTATSDTVEIPYEYLQTGADVYAWVYLTPESGVGYTEYMVTIPVYARPDTTDEEPTPAQQSALDTAISALNSGVESVQAAVAGVQDSIDTALQEAKDSGEFDGADGYTPVKGVDYFDGEKGDTGATGETGNGIASAVLNADYTLTLTYTDGTTWTSGSIRGERGANGETGADGYSPAATVTQTETGATVTITDKIGTTTAQISNGQDGATFTPAVSAEGVISWTNDGGKTNPQPMNIKGPQGDDYILTATDKEDIAQQAAVSLAPALDEKAPIIYSEASGVIASFTDGADDLPVQDLVVQIEPVQAGSGDPSPENVRAITGWTGAKVTRTGKNLLNPLYRTNLPNNIRYYYGTGNATKLKKGTYTLSISQQVNGIYVNQYGSTLFVKYNTTFITFMLDSEADGISFDLYKSNGIDQNVTCQLELGSTATDYEPYQGETYDIDFPTEAGTVYGGSLDVTTGVLTVGRAAVDLGTLDWRYYQNSRQTKYYFRTLNEITNAKFSDGNIPNCICDRYKTESWSMTVDNATADNCITFGWSGRSYIAVCDSAYSDAVAFKTAMSDAQLVYELATPQTYQLTPTEIRTLLGQNNIWADTGDVSVAYRADTKKYVDDAAPVQDVQVNGTSILDAQGVANVPVASVSVYGVIRSGSVSVSGTTPTINALPGIRYICGEVTTIDIVTPASGIIDVVFTSGSTPAVLTVTPPSGMTMRWANGFDPDNLEADTTYEINIADGCLGVAGTWS